MEEKILNKIDISVYIFSIGDLKKMKN
jgi:hypothetical protein